MIGLVVGILASGTNGDGSSKSAKWRIKEKALAVCNTGIGALQTTAAFSDTPLLRRLALVLFFQFMCATELSANSDMKWHWLR